MRYGREWLRPAGGVTTDPPVSLVCCPHAGGTADFFRDWPRWFPPAVQVVAVQYPGHGDRLDEACLADVHQLSSPLAAEVERLGPGKLILFGHSFGAAVAFEAAVRLTQQGSPPHAVLISARVAPHHEAGGSVHLRGDAAIWSELVRLGGTPPDIAVDAEWREMLTPSVRSDFQASETYRPSRTRLPCPITVLRGNDDHDLPHASVNAWHEYTESEFTVRSFSGAHFYLVDHLADIAAEVDRLAFSSRD
jgi:pyochelin biosynthetic protein PchC